MHEMFQYCDLMHRFLVVRVFCASHVSCQPFVDEILLLFLKDLKHLSMNSSWTPSCLRKVSQIYLYKWILILLCTVLSACPSLQHVVYLLTLFTDQGSTYSGDLESEAVSTPHSWEEELNHYTLRSNALPEPDPELKQFSKGDVEQDLEADFPSGQYHGS